MALSGTAPIYAIADGVDMLLSVDGIDLRLGSGNKPKNYGRFATEAICSPSFASDLEKALKLAFEDMHQLPD